MWKWIPTSSTAGEAWAHLHARSEELDETRAELERLNDIDAAVKEIYRAAKLGLRGLELSCSWDMEPMWHPVWEPLWQAVNEVNLPLHFHTFPSMPPGVNRMRIDAGAPDSFLPYQIVYILMASPAQWEKVGKDWLAMRNRAMELLSEENRLSQIVKLVGPDALPYAERMILETSRLLREGILQQNATDPVDAYSPIEKQIRMLELVLYFHERGMSIIKRGAPINLIHDLPVVDMLIRMKSNVSNDDLSKFDDIQKTIDEQMSQLDAEYR